MHTTDKTRAAAEILFLLDRLKARYEGQDKAIILLRDVAHTRDMVWEMLERNAMKRVCECCEVHSSFNVEQWLFADSRNNPLAAAAAVNLVKHQKQA